MPPHRKVPFSNKQKKEQLKAKRERKQKLLQQDENDVSSDQQQQRKDAKEFTTRLKVERLNQQPTSGLSVNSNRYCLQFASDSNEVIAAGKRDARLPLQTRTEEQLELSIDDIYPPDIVLDLPKRPAWNYKMSAAQLEHNEEIYFKDYVKQVFEQCNRNNSLSYFELNLETWRQLWRVIEMSDVILHITDARFPVVHFNPALYNYIVNELHKELILVLNKVDLVAVETAVAWKCYFMEKFPQLHVVYFTSRPDQHSKRSDTATVLKRRTCSRRRFNAIGPEQLLEICQQVTAGAVNLDSWRQKIMTDSVANCSSVASGECFVEQVVDVTDSCRPQPAERYSNGILTIGCCGFPNVGKSSVINALMGKKVVSVSRTPGHTKHFQTIFLTPDVRLCDSPGLVFPSHVCKPLQVLAGIYPIAQLREPFSAIRFLAERLSLIEMLRLKHPDDDEQQQQQQQQQQQRWSAQDVCEAWAVKRGFMTAKAARPDVFRAANNILRLAVDGRITLSLHPPQFSTRRQGEWACHSETTELLNLLGAVNIDKPETPAAAAVESQSECSEESSDEDGQKETQWEEEECEQSQDTSKSDSLKRCDAAVDESYVLSANPFDLLADDA